MCLDNLMLLKVTGIKPGCFLWPGMLPHKTKRGQAALERLKVFDGIPPPYDKVMDVGLSDLWF